MRVLKPSWVNHDSKPIFSVDVHQECLKFATGGQGMDSGRVVIWNLLPVLSEKAEADSSIPKMLCQMDNHLACVNCVRWSNSGQMLASGSDDKLVMIWRKSKGPSGVFGTGGIQKNPESWKCAATLRGHSGDVLDLAWSPQDRWLASCSIDNIIIVWDCQAFPAMVAMLKGHTGLVKGVSWDPVGKFLASQSDDRSVKIWKTSDWSCSSTITDPFEECGGTTHILRLSWSPDGQYLVSAHAMNSGGPTAQIVEREGWKCDKDVVGHRKAVTCVRFHTSILKRLAPKTQKMQQYCCWAVGSRDRSLSVWTTALQRPLVVIHELFNDSVLDISWGPEKCILMACSGDGTVACLQFDETELGTPLSEEDKNSLYQRIYGKSVALANGSGSGADLLAEIPELLFNTSQEKIKPPALPTLAVTNHNNNFIEPSTESKNVLTTTTTPTMALATTSNGNLNVGQIENSNSTFSTENSSPLRAIGKQLETRTPDGKRRITPVFIPLNQDVPTTVLGNQPLSSSTSVATTPATNIPQIGVAVEVTQPVVEFKQPEIKPIITEAEQTRLDSRLVKSTTSTALLQPQEVDSKSVKSFPRIATKRQATPSGPTITACVPYQASTTGPKLPINATTRCEFQKTALDHRVHVSNGKVQTATGPLALVTAYALSVPAKMWEVYVGSPIINLNFCKKYVMLCSLDGSMRLLDMRTGIAMLPVITLTSAAVQCAFCPLGKLVGVITDCGILRIWDVEKTCVTLAITCTEIHGKYGAIVQFQITERGVPLLLFANGNSYSYSAAMQSWLVLNTTDPITRHGLQTTMPREFQKDIHLYPLISVQACTNTFAASGTAIDLNASDWQSAAKIIFIDNQIKLCEAIHSPEELKYWYPMLSYHLALDGKEQRLRMLLDDLLGTAELGSSSSEPSKKRTILAIPKHQLFENCLDVLKSHVKWQRLYVEYKELYEKFEAKPSDDDVEMPDTAKTDGVDDEFDFVDHNTDLLNNAAVAMVANDT